MSYAQLQPTAIAIAMSPGVDRDRDKDRDNCYKSLFQADLSKFVLQQRIGNGRFMKTYIMRVDSVPVVVKVHMFLQLRSSNANQTAASSVNSPYPQSNTGLTNDNLLSVPPQPAGALDERMLLKYFARQLTQQFRVITPARYPNLMPYQMWIHPGSSSVANVVSQGTNSNNAAGFGGVMGSGNSKGSSLFEH